MLTTSMANAAMTCIPVNVKVEDKNILRIADKTVFN